MKNFIAFLVLTLLAYSGMRFIDGQDGQGQIQAMKEEARAEEWEQNLTLERDEVKQRDAATVKTSDNAEAEKDKSWEEARRLFLQKKLTVNGEKIDELDTLRDETIEREKILAAKDVPMNDDQYIIRDIFELKENRRHYENQMASILGADNWKKYVNFYKEYWNLSGREDLSKLYHPLK